LLKLRPSFYDKQAMYPIFYMAFTRSLATTHYTNMVSEVNGFLLTDADYGSSVQRQHPELIYLRSSRRSEIGPREVLLVLLPQSS